VLRPLNFCHLSIFYPPYSFGGDAMYLYRLVNALARQGHEVDVVHCADSFRVLEPRMPTQEFPNHPNVTVHTLKSRWGILSPLLSQQTGGTWLKTNRIREVLLSKTFDVIHYHNISLFGPKVLQLKPDYPEYIKLYTTHEHWLVCPMHVLWKNNERLCDKPECFRCTLKFRRPPQWWRYTRRLQKSVASVDAFLSPSLFTRQMHRDRGFACPMEHLPYFVPRIAQAPADPERPPHGRPFFLFVGRLEKIKGLHTLFPLFRDYPHADLLVAGTGTQEVELRGQAAELRNVVFLGLLPQEQLQALYRHAIAVLVPSLCYEVFGMMILEAHLQRTPVIVNALGGLQEVTEESQGGFVYRTRGELLAAMERLRTDPILRREMGERGYRKYVERWSEEAHLQAYFRIIEQTAQRKFGFLPWEQGERATARDFRPEAGPAGDTAALASVG
jgi:glycosyltransferase involved in cell wall biosynthesis